MHTGVHLDASLWRVLHGLCNSFDLRCESVTSTIKIEVTQTGHTMGKLILMAHVVYERKQAHIKL